MTYGDKASYDSKLPCNYLFNRVYLFVYVYISDVYTYI